MERDEAKKVSFAKRQRANFLAESKGVHFCSVRCFEMFDGFPVESRVPVERYPVEFSQPSQRGDHLLQFDGFKPK